MKFCTNRFALAAATTMALVEVALHFALRFFGCQLKGLGWSAHHWHPMMKAAGKGKAAMPQCPALQMLFIKVVSLFVVTFAAAWFFAWFYNCLTCDMKKK